MCFGYRPAKSLWAVNIFTSLRPKKCGLLPLHTVANADHPRVTPEQGGAHQEKVNFGKAALILIRCAAFWHWLESFVKEWKGECGHMDTNPSAHLLGCLTLFLHLLKIVSALLGICSFTSRKVKCHGWLSKTDFGTFKLRYITEGKNSFELMWTAL